MTPKTKQLIRDWHDALRSGEYRQGLRQLYDTKSGAHCCLGVLCEVAGYRRREQRYAGKSLLLPPKLARTLGGSYPILVVPARLKKKSGNHGHVDAARLNDTFKFTFKQIAQCVKATWPEAWQDGEGE